MYKFCFALVLDMCSVNKIVAYHKARRGSTKPLISLLSAMSAKVDFSEATNLSRTFLSFPALILSDQNIFLEYVQLGQLSNCGNKK